MKFEVNIEKKYAFMILGALLILIVAIGVYAAVDKTTAWHGSDSVEVMVNGTTMSLQEAVDSEALMEGYVSVEDVVWDGPVGTILKDGATAQASVSPSSMGRVTAYAKFEEGEFYLRIKINGLINSFYSKTCDWEQKTQLVCTSYSVGGSAGKATATINPTSGVSLTLSGYGSGSDSGSWS